MLVFYMALIDDKEDAERFERIYLGYRQRMFAVAMRILQDPMEAEDAVHNAFLSIAKTIETVPQGNEQEEKAYILTAAKHAALRVQKNKSRWDAATQQLKMFHDEKESVFDWVAASWNRELLCKAIEAMPGPYREVLLLVCVYEQSCKNAAHILHRKESTVRKQLQRGREYLAKVCGEEVAVGEDREIGTY